MPAGRTRAACAGKRHRLRLGQPMRDRVVQPVYTKQELAQRLGVEPRKVVYWRGKGWLAGIHAEQRGEWTYTRSAVRRFLMGRGRVVLDFARVDHKWMIGVLAPEISSSGGGKREAAI